MRNTDSGHEFEEGSCRDEYVVAAIFLSLAFWWEDIKDDAYDIFILPARIAVFSTYHFGSTAGWPLL